jgi:hypothetical protein
MPYTIQRTSNDHGDLGWPLTVNDGTIDTTSTGLNIVGRGKSNYGKPIAENFIRLLENFSSNTQPSNPITGQLWFKPNTSQLFVCTKTNPSVVWEPVNTLYYDSIPPVSAKATGALYLENSVNNGKLWFYDGFEWKKINGIDISVTTPVSSLNTGNLWYNPLNNRLYIYIGVLNNWLPIINGEINDNSYIEIINPISAVGLIKFRNSTDTLAVYSTDNVPQTVISGYSDMSYFSEELVKGFNTVDIKINGLVYESISDNIQATGTTQTSAAPVNKSNNFVTNVVAGSEESIRLPDINSFSIGMVINVWNLSSNNLVVFPPVGKKIETNPVNVPVNISPGQRETFIARNINEYWRK